MGRVSDEVLWTDQDDHNGKNSGGSETKFLVLWVLEGGVCNGEFSCPVECICVDRGNI
jgi:hypothetical protein